MLDLFLSMFAIGAISFGGGYAIIPQLQYQVVTRMGLVTPTEFVDAIAVGQFTPGPVLIMAAFIGYRAAGWAGASVAILGLFTPSFIAVLLLGSVYERIHGDPRVKLAFAGVGAAVVGLLAATIVGLVPTGAVVIPSAALACAVCALALTTKVEPALLVVASGALGLVLFR
jgi:chromate transporter